MMAMCVDHDESIHGKLWKDVQSEIFNNRFEGDAEAANGCCIKKVNGKLMGVYGKATLPCLEERTIPGKTCDEMEWADRKHCICNLITGKMRIPTCSVDSHCPEGKKCCWTKNGDVCTMNCV